MWRSLSFWSSDASRSSRLALKIAAAASVGVLVACSAQEGSAPAPVVAVNSSVPKTTISATPSPSTTAEAAPTELAVQPKVEKKTVVEVQKIPFKKTTVKDSSLKKGRKVVTTRGVNGAKRLTYEVTVTDAVQTGKRLLHEVISTPPIDQVTAIGTAAEPQSEPEPEPKCDPNYSGACVPIASDVDCAGGSGNGPAYVRGPVRVVGTDIYDLDRDSDGIGCED
jgi:hypothetical protein